MIAADSNSVNGLPPGPSESTIAGMRWLGLIFRNSGLNWSPAPISTGIILYSRRSSSSAICTLWPFGVGHDQTSNIVSLLLSILFRELPERLLVAAVAEPFADMAEAEG